MKAKPRYEFVIVFAWKEPTPSDKLRPIKVKEAAAAPASGGPGMGGSPSPTSPGPKGGSSGGEAEGGLNARGGLKIDD
jgi:hypothetical protein